MRAYGINPKTGSRGNRVGTHPDGCICKMKKVSKKRARRTSKLQLRNYYGRGIR